MITTTSSPIRAQREFRWDHMKSRLTEWRRRARSRHELHGLSDATLRDIGLSRCDAHNEINKPFWMA